MEILNNIWNALSTENLQFSTIMGYPLLFIENFLILMLFINLLNIQLKLLTKKGLKIILNMK